jgi:hypothetical protein
MTPSLVVKEGNRAGEVVGRIRDLVKKAPPRKDRVEINGAIREVIELTYSQAVKNGVSVQTQFAESLPSFKVKVIGSNYNKSCST